MLSSTPGRATAFKGLGSARAQGANWAMARPSARARSVVVRSTVEVSPSKGSNGAAVNGAGGLDASAVEADVLRELHYRLAAQGVDNAELYESTSWSVHNRLVETWDKTHTYWK